MALSLLNYFVLKKEEYRLPLMVVDLLVVLGLHQWEKKMKAEKVARDQEAALAEAQQREVNKQGKHAEKLAQREQRKAQEQKTKHVNGHPNFGPKNPIMQPDKNKKSR